MGRTQSRKKNGRYGGPVPQQRRQAMVDKWVRDGWGTEAEFDEAMGELIEAGLVHVGAGSGGQVVPQMSVRLSTIHRLPAADFEDGFGTDLHLVKDALGRWMPRPGSGWQQLEDGDWILFGPQL